MAWRRGTGPLRRSAGRGPGKGRVRPADQRCAPAPAREPDLEFAAPAGPNGAARRSFPWPRTLIFFPRPPLPSACAPCPFAPAGARPPLPAAHLGTRSPASRRLGTRMKDRLEQLKAVSPVAPRNQAGRGLPGWSCAGGLPALPQIEVGVGGGRQAYPPQAVAAICAGSAPTPPLWGHVPGDSSLVCAVLGYLQLPPPPPSQAG